VDTKTTLGLKTFLFGCTQKTSGMDKAKSQLRLANLSMVRKLFPRGTNSVSIPPDSLLLERYKALSSPLKFLGVTPEKFCGVTIYRNRIFLDSPIPFAQGLRKLSSVVDELRNHEFRTQLRAGFSNFASSVEKTKETKAIQIKGIIAQGDYSSVFVTSDNDVLKLSTKPACPSPENMIEGVDLLIKNRFSLKGKDIPAFVEPLVENSSLRRLSDEEFESIGKTFLKRIKERNSDYGLTDFAKCQIGFIEDTPYLLDHQCIEGRPLVGQ